MKETAKNMKESIQMVINEFKEIKKGINQQEIKKELNLKV